MPRQSITSRIPDRFHLAMHAVRLLPCTGDQGAALIPELEAKLLEHKRHIAEHGEDMPEIRD